MSAQASPLCEPGRARCGDRGGTRDIRERTTGDRGGSRVASRRRSVRLGLSARRHRSLQRRRASSFGRVDEWTCPPPAVVQRRVVAKTPPPPPPVPFAARESAMKDHPGRPADPQTLGSLRAQDEVHRDAARARRRRPGARDRPVTPGVGDGRASGWPAAACERAAGRARSRRRPRRSRRARPSMRTSEPPERQEESRVTPVPRPMQPAAPPGPSQPAHAVPRPNPDEGRLAAQQAAERARLEQQHAAQQAQFEAQRAEQERRARDANARQQLQKQEEQQKRQLDDRQVREHQQLQQQQQAEKAKPPQAEKARPPQGPKPQPQPQPSRRSRSRRRRRSRLERVARTDSRVAAGRLLPRTAIEPWGCTVSDRPRRGPCARFQNGASSCDPRRSE